VTRYGGSALTWGVFAGPPGDFGEFVGAMPDFSHQVQRLIALQDGVVGRHQLLARGVRVDAVKHAVDIGRLVRLHPGVYAAIPVALLGPDARLIAALLATRSRAVLGVGTAAHRWNLVPAPPMRIELISRLHLVEPRGVTIHRTVLRPGDVDRNGRFRTTTPTRTLLDLGVRYEPQALLRALEEAEFHHRVYPADILATCRRGHPGSTALRAALELHVPGYGAMRSELERRFRKLLIAHVITLPERNQRLGRWTVDCLWRELKVVVELDGGQHSRPGQAAVDAERDLWLRRSGYIVRRYTWEQVTGRDNGDVVADLRDAFAEAKARQDVATRQAMPARAGDRDLSGRAAA